MGCAALIALIALVADHASNNAAAAAPRTNPAMWDLSDLYLNEQAWARDYARIKDEAQRLDAYKGTLGANAAAMLKVLCPEM